jgi:hypothetical protein
MKTNELLRSLGASPTLNKIRSDAMAPGAPQGFSFEQMLDQARSGGVSSGISVKVAKGLDIKLNADQLARAAAAADVAEANGASRAMVILDGRAYRMDVGTRTIIGEASGTEAAAMADVDAVVTAPASREELANRPVRVSLPAADPLSIGNASLRQVLERD